MASGSTEKGKVAIVGSGLIGRSWAMLFASFGYRVSIYDVLPSQVENALSDITIQLKTLKENGHLRGNRSDTEQRALISGSTSLQECVQGAFYIQESVPENKDLKRKVFAQIDPLMDDGAILATSTSVILPSLLSDTLKHRDHFIVAHPANPPYFVPIVEVVPAPWTLPEVTAKTRELMTEIGQAPITCLKEINGFISNRIQYQIINESWRLIEGGYATVEDVDTVMSEGLGMLYCFMGPMLTMALNSPGGLADSLERYKDSIYEVTSDLGPIPHMKRGGTGQCITQQLEAKVPLEKLQERRLWRNKCLTALAKVKHELKPHSADS